MIVPLAPYLQFQTQRIELFFQRLKAYLLKLPPRNDFYGKHLNLIRYSTGWWRQLSDGPTPSRSRWSHHLSVFPGMVRMKKGSTPLAHWPCLQPMTSSGYLQLLVFKGLQLIDHCRANSFGCLVSIWVAILFWHTLYEPHKRIHHRNRFFPVSQDIKKSPLRRCHISACHGFSSPEFTWSWRSQDSLDPWQQLYSVAWNVLSTKRQSGCFALNCSSLWTASPGAKEALERPGRWRPGDRHHMIFQAKWVVPFQLQR